MYDDLRCDVQISMNVWRACWSNALATTTSASTQEAVISVRRSRVLLASLKHRKLLAILQAVTGYCIVIIILPFLISPTQSTVLSSKIQCVECTIDQKLTDAAAYAPTDGNTVT